jgi:hypothetical protein
VSCEFWIGETSKLTEWNRDSFFSGVRTLHQEPPMEFERTRQLGWTPINLNNFRASFLWCPTCQIGWQNAGESHRRKGVEETMSRESLRFLSEQEINRIQQLLVATELSFQNIADRMDCAKSTVIAINRKFSIRSYGGRRNYWEVTASQFSETGS